MSQSLKGSLVAFVAVLIISPDSLFVRLIATDTATLLFWRGVGLGLALFAVMLAIHGRDTLARYVAVGWPGLIAAALLAGSTVFFVVALSLTSVGNTLAMMSTAPIFAAVASRLVLKERTPLRTWIAAMAAVLCIVIIVSESVGSGSFWGDIAAIGNGACLASCFVFMRWRKSVSMIPAMSISGVMTVIFALTLGMPTPLSQPQWGLMLGLCFIILPVAFAMISFASRLIPSAELNMFLLMEMVFGPFFVWIVISEQLPRSTLIGGGILFVVLFIHSIAGIREERRILHAAPAVAS